MTNTINLSLLPAPDVVQSLDYDTILSEMLADLRHRAPELTALVESDPAYKILQVAAYRELLLRQRVNDAGRSVMLAYAKGRDLDHLAALFGLQRQRIEEGDPHAIPRLFRLFLKTMSDFGSVFRCHWKATARQVLWGRMSTTPWPPLVKSRMSR